MAPMFQKLIRSKSTHGFKHKFQESDFLNHQPTSQIGLDDDYVYIWDELSNATGDLPGDDIVTWGSSFEPYHNYSEILDILHSADTAFPQFVKLGTIGKTYYEKDIWYIKLTDENSSKSKTSR